MLSHKVIKELLPLSPAPNVEAYSCNSLAIFKPDVALKGKLQTSTYSFIIPYNEVPEIIINDKIYTIEKNTIFSVHPDQKIECIIKKEIYSYFTLFFDKNFFINIANGLSKNENIVFFENKAFFLDDPLRAFIQSFISEFINKQLGYECILQCISTQIAIHLLRHIQNTSYDEKGNLSYSQTENINKAIDYLKTYYGENFSLNDIAKAANLSPFHFIRVFKSQTGKTPFEYLTDIKISKAKEMLHHNKYNITEISFLCGFSNPSHFSSVFKKKTGISPSEYRRQVIL